jgi:hypothetical protein
MSTTLTHTLPPAGPRTTSYPGSRARRNHVGAALCVFALVHAAPAMFAMAGVPWWLNGEQQPREWMLWAAAIPFAIALTGYFGAGLGLLGIESLRWRVGRLTRAGLASSLLFTLLFLPQHAWLLIAGNAAVFLSQYAIDDWSDAPQPAVRRPRMRVIVAGLAWLLLFGLTAVAVMRPVYLRWGATDEEARAPLPGDPFKPTRAYQVLHAVSIDAPPSEVWKWLVQIGQDRGGFYSYAWLENTLGARIHNGGEIVPEWQQRAPGDFIPAVHRDWLGGSFRDVAGWTATAVEPGSHLVLRDWGAFVLLPEHTRGTRFVIRTLGNSEMDFPLFASIFGMFVFEPAHLIMQRKMMLEIKHLSELSWRGFTGYPDPW